MGIEAVEVRGAEIVVTYDLLQATAAQIETAFADAGARLGSGGAERLRRGLFTTRKSVRLATCRSVRLLTAVDSTSGSVARRGDRGERPYWNVGARGAQCVGHTVVSSVLPTGATVSPVLSVVWSNDGMELSMVTSMVRVTSTRSPAMPTTPTDAASGSFQHVLADHFCPENDRNLMPK